MPKNVPVEPLYDYSKLEYPKQPSDGNNYDREDRFPAAELDDRSPHPLVTACKTNKIEAVEVVGDWFMDDHVPCFNVVVQVAGKKYGISFWWMGTMGMEMIFQAATGIDKYMEVMRQEILSSSV